MRALRNFTTAIQRLPTKLRRIVDFLHAARRPKLTFMLSLPDGRDVVNDEEDEMFGQPTTVSFERRRARVRTACHRSKSTREC